ncbi:MAG: hypothetical protein ACOCVA_05630 [Prolixibacteraceae bacterium]
MKKVLLFTLALVATGLLQAQEKFEVRASAKAGYYFLKNEHNNPYYPESAFSPGAGVSLSCYLLPKTSVSLGVEGNYLSPEMIDFRDNNLNVRWHSLNIPLNIEQIIAHNFFLSGGATLVRQLEGYWDSPITGLHPQKIPEYHWQAGGGYNFGKWRLSLNYARGFNTIEKKIKTSNNSYFGVDVQHQEIYLKVEYPLWKF